MPGPFPPTDDLVGPIATAIKNLIAAQIPSINPNNIYVFLPDTPPTDGSVLLPMTRMKLLHNYSGKVQYQITYACWHVFRRRKMSDTLTAAYTYITPWLKFLEAWPNQTLGGLAEEVTATDIVITQKVDNGQPYVYLICTFNVVTNINIPTS